MSPPQAARAGTAASMEETAQVRQFLYREARLLDERRYDEWLALLAEDLQYWMPSRSTPSQNQQEKGNLAIERELSAANELGLLRSDKAGLTARSLRLQSGRSFSEMPPSRVQRLVGNIEVQYTKQPDVYRVYSVCLVHRTRLETAEHTLIGRRSDLLQRSHDSFLLRERKIVLNSTVLKSPNLSMFL